MTRCCRAAALAVLIACPVGCLGMPRQMEILEAQLRKQEDSLYALRSELESKSAELAATRREVDMLRTQQADAGQTAVPAEHVMVVSRATGIRFHSLLTRPLDRDDQPGPEVLNVVLTPHDADEETVKLPGGLRMELLDLSQAEGERTVAAWDFNPDESRTHWHSGFIATGYRFELPWPESAPAGKLMLLARFTTPDGRHFEATHEIAARDPSATPRIVDRTAASASPELEPGPALSPATTAVEASSTASGAPPVFDLPVFDAADRKPEHEWPAEPQKLSRVEAGDPELTSPPELELTAPPAIGSEAVDTDAADSKEMEPPTPELPAAAPPAPLLQAPALPVPALAAPVLPAPSLTAPTLPAPEKLESPFGASRTEFEPASSIVVPRAATSPFEPATAESATVLASGDRSGSSAGATLPWVGPVDSPAAAPEVVLPLDGVEWSGRQSAGIAAGAPPLHRLGVPVVDPNRPRRFYRTQAVTAYAPTVILSPSDGGTQKADAGVGAVRISGN